MICDTSGMLAALDQSDVNHEIAAKALNEAPGPFVLSPYVIAELDYMLRKETGHRNARFALAELASGAYEFPAFEAGDMRRALEIDTTYTDLGIGLTDASVVVLAARYDTRDLLTFDQRHFRKIAPIQGGAFRLLPLDS
jgi:predicted nucleic acid-binding protein